MANFTMKAPSRQDSGLAIQLSGTEDRLIIERTDQPQKVSIRSNAAFKYSRRAGMIAADDYFDVYAGDIIELDLSETFTTIYLNGTGKLRFLETK